MLNADLCVVQDITFLARYPFLRGAVELIRREKIELETLLNDEIYARAREQGIKRAMQAIKNPNAGFEQHITDEITALHEILSYPVARMIISATRDKSAINRYAVAESKNFSSLAISEEPDTLISIANELGIEACYQEKFSMHFTTYLQYTTQFRGIPEWKLAYQDIRRGSVFLPKEKFVRILEEALKRKIENELPLPVDRHIETIFSMTIAEIRNAMKTQYREIESAKFGDLNEDAFPPCMKHILSMIRNGENAPHMARFAIVAFLKGIGLNSEEILKLFATSPDFDISKSRYQVEHITGKTSHTTYKSPGCATMKSYGLCVPENDELCKKPWLKHPWIYYRRKRKELKKATS